MGISAGAGNFRVCARTRIQALSDSRWKAASSRRSAFDSASRAMLTRIKPEIGATSLKDETLLSLESRGAGFGPFSRLQECTNGLWVAIRAAAFRQQLIKLFEVDDLGRGEEGERLRLEVNGRKRKLLDLRLEVAIRTQQVDREDTPSDAMAEVPRGCELLNCRRHLLVELIDHDEIATEFPDAANEAVQLLVF